MAAYMVARVDITDSSWMAPYSAVIEELLARHGGRFLVATDQIEQWERAAPAPQRLVVVEFPDMDAMRAFYDDPDYEPLKEARIRGSASDVLVVQGVE